MDTLFFKINYKFKYLKIEDINEGIIVVNTCSNLCNHNSSVEYLKKLHKSYEIELNLKMLNSDFNRTLGRTILTRVTNKLTIISIFSEYFLSNKREFSFDAINDGFNFIKLIRRMDSREEVFIPKYLGSDMTEDKWSACISIINCYVKDATFIGN